MFTVFVCLSCGSTMCAAFVQLWPNYFGIWFALVNCCIFCVCTANTEAARVQSTCYDRQQSVYYRWMSAMSAGDWCRSWRSVNQLLQLIISSGGTYTENCALLGLEILAARKSRKLFKQITLRNGHCLHHLLPAKRDETVTSRLRRSVKQPQMFARTNRFKNFYLVQTF